MQIILINIVLSGDNAVVIAMASKNLPQKLRKRAVIWGASVAIILRLLLTIVAVYLMKVPYLQVVGSVLLVYVAIKMLLDDNDHSSIGRAYSFMAVVWTIIVADFVMSLDNVLAIAAVAKGNVMLLFFGISLSIPLIIWGSAMIMNLLEKYPIFIYIGAGILGYTAGEMFLNEPKIQQLFLGVHESFHWFIPLLFTMVVIFSGLLKPMLFNKL